MVVVMKAKKIMMKAKDTKLYRMYIRETKYWNRKRGCVIVSNKNWK